MNDGGEVSGEGRKGGEETGSEKGIASRISSTELDMYTKGDEANDAKDERSNSSGTAPFIHDTTYEYQSAQCKSPVDLVTTYPN